MKEKQYSVDGDSSYTDRKEDGKTTPVSMLGINAGDLSSRWR